MRYIYIVFLVAGLMSSFTAIAQENQQSQQDVFQSIYNASKEKIQSQQYQYIGEYVYQNKTREILEGNSNTLSINGSNANGKITALKKANKTFVVDGTIKDYDVDYNDSKRTIRVKFKVESPAEGYDVLIDVKPNGNAFLTLKNSAMETISWTGKLAALD